MITSKLHSSNFSITSQCPPLSGPIRRKTPSRLSFAIARATVLLSTPITSAISCVPTNAFARIDSRIFCGVFCGVFRELPSGLAPIPPCAAAPVFWRTTRNHVPLSSQLKILPTNHHHAITPTAFNVHRLRNRPVMGAYRLCLYMAMILRKMRRVGDISHRQEYHKRSKFPAIWQSRNSARFVSNALTINIGPARLPRGRGGCSRRLPAAFRACRAPP